LTGPLFRLPASSDAEPGTKMGRLTEKWAALSQRLGFRMALSVGTILLSTYALFIYVVLDLQQEFYFGQTIREAERFSAAVINATNHSMLQDDRETTQNIIANIGRQHDISDIRIFDHDGVVKFSSRSTDLGSKVDKKAEACFVCHSEDKPFREVVTDKRSRVYSHEGHRILGMITPIYNKKGCYQAACHVHPEEQKILGVLDTGMSLQGFDSHNRALVFNTIFVGIGTFGAVVFTIGLYITFRVHRPVRELRDAAMKIAMGESSEKLRVITRDEIGECAWAFNLMRDQIRRRTQELIRSREDYKLLFEQVPCYICVVDRKLEIVRQNSSMRELFKSGIGVKCYEAFKKRNSKCEDCHLDITFKEGKVSGKEHCGLKFSGEEANYLSYTTPIVNEKGDVLYAMIIAMDIGEKVQLRKALEASRDFQTKVIENSIHGIVATNELGRVNIYNIAAENLFGYHINDVMGDADIEKYFPQPFVRLILDSYVHGKRDETRLIAQESTIVAKDGETIPVRFSGFLLFTDQKTAGAVGFFQDVRMFKQLEREKLASDRLAVAGQTVAGLAHGIKNILTGLEGGVFVLETALEDHDDNLFARGWTMVRNNIDRVSALVKDLLSYSKERAPKCEETDPNLLAEEVCALFDMKVLDTSVEIVRDFDPQAGKIFKIFLDQRGIHTCLSNLVANAIDACELDHNRPAHRIIVKTLQDDDGDLIYEVSDNGAGMTEETKLKLFSSFYSTKGSRGTGLGLMVTSKIVAEHSGRISFVSEEGVGTTFTLRLPPGKSSGGAKSPQHSPAAV
jgi:histidine kinase